MNKSNQFVIISFTVMIMSIVYSSMAYATTSHSCRLHNKAFFAHINLPPFFTLQEAIEMCDRAMPGQVRKQHIIETTKDLGGGPIGLIVNVDGSIGSIPSESGTDIHSHNPTDCIEVVPND